MTTRRAEHSVLAAALLAVVVVGLISWLHFAQRQAIEEGAAALVSVRSARVDLARGFLAFGLSDPASPWRKEEGLALLRQGMASIAKASPSDQERGRFAASASGFESALAAWRAAPEVRHLAALHIAYGNLDRAALQVDQQIAQDLLRLKDRSDTQFFLALFGSTLALGLTVAIVFVSSRKQAAAARERDLSSAAREESEARFHAIYEHAAVGIAITAANDGRFIKGNQWFCNMLGYTQEELQNISFLDLIHPEDLEVDLALLPRLLSGELSNIAREVRTRRKDGSHLWISVNASLVRQADGNPDYLVAAIQDIHARREAQGELASQARELQIRNEELERFQRLTVDREMDMIEMKKEINTLARELGREPPYSLDFLDETPLGED